MGDLTLTHERIDDIPLLVKLGQKLQLDTAVDTHLGTHGLHQGLSNGQLTVVWLAYILSEGDHRKAHVEDWAWRHRRILARLLGCPVRRVDFTDDRLGNLLQRFSVTAKWQALEAAVWRTSVAVYALETELVRVDSTTSYGYHQVQPEGVMQHGYSKDHRPDLPQLKLMAAMAEPGGHWVGTDLYSGEEADDDLYLPLIGRVRTLVGPGKLYCGDGKMGSLATRASLAAAGDYYLTRLGRNLVSESHWQAWEAQRDAADSMTLLWVEGQVVGWGCEWAHALSAPVAAVPFTWEERLQWVYAPARAAQQRQALETRLQQAEAALWALTPAPGRGKRQIRDEAALQTRIHALETQYQVAGLLHVQWVREEQRQTQYVGRGRGNATRPTRAVVQARYQIIAVARDPDAVAAVQAALGWAVQVTNAPVSRLTLPVATRTYREGWHLEHTFHTFKAAPIGVSPLFVWQDDQIQGLTRLLTLALRLLTLIETQVAQGLAAAGTPLAGLYEGQPTRTTAHPTAKRLLRSLGRADITWTLVQMTNHSETYLSPRPPWLAQVLAYLQLPLDLYDSLTDNSSFSF